MTKRVTKKSYSLIVLMLAASGISMTQAEVYKSITPDGRVVYTDNADNAYRASQDPAKIIVLDKLTPAATTTPVAVSANAASNTASPILAAQTTETISSQSLQLQPVTSPPVVEGQQELPTQTITESKKGDYQLVINKPAVDMAYRRVSQTIDVEVTAIPALRAGDRFVYAINGKHIATTKNATLSIPTDAYYPEKYIFSVKIENVKGDIVASAERPFYILANNFAIQKQRKAAAAAKAAYDKLPWYKKIKVHINL